jgi:hypothetical protein
MNAEMMGRAMMELMRRCSNMDDASAAAEVGEFLGEFGGVEEFEVDRYASDPFEDPVMALRRKLTTPVAHNLEYNYGPAATPSLEEAYAYEAAQRQEMRAVASGEGFKMAGNGKAMPRAEYNAGRRKVSARAAKRRLAKRGFIPKKGG